MRLLWFLLLIVLPLGLTQAQIRVDLDGDGQVEVVSLKKHGTIREEDDVIDCSHLVVSKITGKKKTVLWEDKAREYVFEDSREYGYADILCCAGDLDGTGVIAVIGASLPDDPGPVEFSSFIWKEGRLRRVMQGTFLAPIPNLLPMESYRDNVELIRTDPATTTPDGYLYLADIREVVSPGVIRGDIASHHGFIATALLRGTPQGFRVQKWETAFEPYEEDEE